MPAKGKAFDEAVDTLFRLPLSDFIGARKDLAARLKKEGRTNEAERVKTLPKPSISVWAVNQLYWQHREQFDELMAAGQRFRRAHTSRTAKPVELNEALAARRAALNQLSDLATALLRGAGHNPGPDIMRRVATTLEAVSAYAVLPDDQSPGRLTKDLDPPGFESLAPFIRAVPTTRQPQTVPSLAANKSAAATKTANVARIKAERRLEETRTTKLAAARGLLQKAKKLLVEARSKAQSLAAALKKAEADRK